MRWQHLLKQQTHQTVTQLCCTSTEHWVPLSAYPASILGFSDVHLIFCARIMFLHLSLTSFSKWDPGERLYQLPCAIQNNIFLKTLNNTSCFACVYYSYKKYADVWSSKLNWTKNCSKNRQAMSKPREIRPFFSSFFLSSLSLIALKGTIWNHLMWQSQIITTDKIQ